MSRFENPRSRAPRCAEALGAPRSSLQNHSDDRQRIFEHIMNLNLLSHPRTGPSETAFAAVDSLPSTLNFVTPSPKNFYMFDDDCDSMGSNSITDSMGDADAEMCEIFQTSGSGSRGESGSGRQNQNDLKDVGNTRCPPPPSPIPWWGGNQQGQKRSFTTGFPTINDGGRSSAVSIPRPENPHASDLERSYGEDNVIRGKKRKNNNNGYEENKSNITNFKLKTTDTHTPHPTRPSQKPTFSVQLHQQPQPPT